MAVNDPAWGVPTPTGTLQGVAAFGWDGAAWQPSGRAMPSVATPTGVLRGVAPFSWSGSSWQSGGMSRPGVPTPSGTLDGVALYTWNGSAWAPPGGGTTPTPTGTLQGVAAFSWDGTAWQPAGQARSWVPTPNGTLQGVAMFSWNGSAWAPTVSPASLDLNFLTMSVLDPRITFTRASTATYFDASGVMLTAAANAARFDSDPATHASRGLLIEESRTNLALQSANLAAAPWGPQGIGVAAPAVTANAATAPDGTATATSVAFPAVPSAGNASQVFQTITATAAAYTFSIYLRGGVGGEQLYIGTNSAGTYYSAARITLTTNWQRYTLVTPALTAAGWTFNFGTDRRDGAQAATSAQTIYAWGAQVEAGAFATSYVATTSVAATRAADVAVMSPTGWFSGGTGSIVTDFSINETQFGNQMLFDLWDGSHNNEVVSYVNAAQMPTAVVTGGTNVWSQSPTATITPGTVYKAGFAWSASTGVLYLNGTQLVSAAATGAGPTAPTQFYLGVWGGGANFFLDGCLRRVRYWPRALSNAELQQVTT